MELIEARAEVRLGLVRDAEAADGEEAAEGVREAEVVLKLRHHCGVGFLRQQPSRPGARAQLGGRDGHAA
jgi:hypothetical protein